MQVDICGSQEIHESALGTLQPALPSSVRLQTNHLDGVASTSSTGAPGEPLFRPVIQGSVDGNTVDMDVERNQFADNAIRYEASLIMINGQLKSMLTAINGQ